MLAVCALVLAACQSPSSTPPTAAQALQACELAGLPALRTADAAVTALDLGPVDAASVRQPLTGEVSMVLRGLGRVQGSSAYGEVEWLCVMARRGGVLFVEVAPADAALAVDGCGGDRTCLRHGLDRADQDLAQAEAKAIKAADAAGGADDPVAASIGAWRVYRDAECTRRADLRRSAASDSCRIAMTRARIRELIGR